MINFVNKKNKIIKGISSKNISEDYFKSLEKVHETKEYKQNEKQIQCIKKVLIERAEIPEKLIDWLVEAVEENVALEYEFSKNIY